MKICYRCKESKDYSEFNKNKARKDGHNSACRECMKVIRKAHYDNNSEAIYRAMNDRRIMLRNMIWDYKAEHPCTDCKVQYDPWVMEFDHLSNKEFNISKMVADGFGLERIMKEIDKCEVVCANCHRTRTAQRAGWVRSSVLSV